MPMYDYRCEHCSETFTELTRYEQRDEVKCPRCGEVAKRQLSAFSTAGAGSVGGGSHSHGGGGFT